MNALLSSEAIGWLATVIFTGSYFARQQRTLRRVQMGGAMMWIAYGVATGALPVIAANALVLCAAGWAELSRRGTAPIGADESVTG